MELIWVMAAVLIVSTIRMAKAQSVGTQISGSVFVSRSQPNTIKRESTRMGAAPPPPLFVADGSFAFAFQGNGQAECGGGPHLNSFRAAPRHFLFDQKAIWTSPAHVRLPELTFLIPLGGITAGFLATDSDVSRNLGNTRDTLNRYQDFSNYSLGAMAGAMGGVYVLGLATRNEHERETGFLSGEAAVDSVVAAEALKYATRRERPLAGNGQGKFWSGGDSFPSIHAAAAWSIAGIVAHEYPGLAPRIAAYGLASALSASRVLAKQHFPSDVLVGSALGWLISGYVYREHHNPELAGGAWGFLGVHPERSGEWQAKDMGSPEVPLDSWIYPALLRLAALGYIKDDFEGMRPWTRMECARLVEEASDNIAARPEGSKEAEELYTALEKELSREIELLGGGDNVAGRIESVYTRVTGISGSPLTDGYHFGQTIVNDYGRPFEEGFNDVTGFSGWASAGPFVGYFRGEYQHAPNGATEPLAARQWIAQVDEIGATPPATSAASINQFRLLDSYVGLNIDNVEISFGKRSQWWGPSEGGPLMFSDNAEPVTMLEVTNVKPFRLPSILRWLGPVRGEFFIGRLSGQDFIYGVPTGVVGQFGVPLSDQPFINGQKITVRPTSNLEFSISKTAIFGGPGVPVTWSSFYRSVFARSNAQPGTPGDPGDRRTGADVTYRVPGLRDFLTVYADAFSEDEISPLAYPRKSAMQGGIYVPRIPGLSKLDFRAEGGFTEPPGFWDCQGCFYFNDRFLDGLTNRGNLMASWLGRAGEGEQLWSTYWADARNSIKFGYRHSKIAPDFVPGGGTLTDASIAVNWWIHSDWSVSGVEQLEKWNIPILAPAPQTNWTTSVQVVFWPKFLLK